MRPRRASTVIFFAAVLAAGCTVGPGAPTPTPTASPAPSPSGTPVPPTSLIGRSDGPLDPGTYVVAPNGPGAGAAIPGIEITLGNGWQNIRDWAMHKGSLDNPTVAVQFWEVGKVYRHPCAWQGTLFDPGPSVDDLATALAAIPLRNASVPTDVVLGGKSGKYFEWSVPADADFTKCDADAGQHYFESWTGKIEGDRYQQAPGQVDRLWILDVDGFRLVIDAFIMPGAPQLDIDDLLAAVESVQFGE
jgi:hypothetical protein